MTIFQAVVLGIVQGFTEFLPISSSAHLYLVPYFFGWDYQGLGFDVALHWGTLAAVLLLFWRDYIAYLKGFFELFGKSRNLQNQNQKLALLLILGTLPAAAAGFLLESQAESVFRSPVITIVMLSVFGILLWLADSYSKSPAEAKPVSYLSYFQGLLVGIAQAISIIPGVSRSGVTMTAGLFLGLSRVAAARFSFLLLGPVAFGAGLVTLPSLGGVTAELIFGFLAAVFSGLFAIRFLLRYVSHRTYSLFVLYRLLLAVVVAMTLIF